MDRHLPANAGGTVRFLVQEDPKYHRELSLFSTMRSSPRSPQLKKPCGQQQRPGVTKHFKKQITLKIKCINKYTKNVGRNPLLLELCKSSNFYCLCKSTCEVTGLCHPPEAFCVFRYDSSPTILKTKVKNW